MALDVDYFKAPAINSVLAPTDSISFVADDVSNDYDDTLKAVLYRADGTWVEDIGEWTGADIASSDDFQFTWNVDVGEGDYFVRIFEIDPNDHDSDDDINRSYTFTIRGTSQQPASYAAASADSQTTKGADEDIVKAVAYSEEEQSQEVIEEEPTKKAKKADGKKKEKSAQKASGKEGGDSKKKKKKSSQKKKEKEAELTPTEAEIASAETDSKSKDKTKIASADMRKKRSIYGA